MQDFERVFHLKTILFVLYFITYDHARSNPTVAFCIVILETKQKKLYHVLFRVWMSSKTANFLKCDFAVSGAEKTHTFLPWAPPSSLQHTVPTIGEETAVEQSIFKFLFVCYADQYK